MANYISSSNCFEYLTVFCSLYIFLFGFFGDNSLFTIGTHKKLDQRDLVQLVPSNNKLLFIEFSRMKKIASSFVYVLSTFELSIQYKLAYFKLAIQFLALQQNLLKLNDDLLQNFTAVSRNLNRVLEKSLRKERQLKEEELDEFLDHFKSFYKKLKEEYIVVSSQHRAGCQQKMQNQEKTITGRIYQVQKGM